MSAQAGATPTALEGPLAAPKYGTLIPNRIFVGGISGDTTESDLCRVFSAYGNVKSTKIIVDRAGVSKGYGFVTFETEQEAQRLQTDGECVVLRDRKLNIAPAIKKQVSPAEQSIVATNGAVYYAATPPAPISNMPIDQFAAAVYPPSINAAGVPTIYPPSMQYQPFYQYYSVPMVNMPNVPTIWPQNYQASIDPPSQSSSSISLNAPHRRFEPRQVSRARNIFGSIPQSKPKMSKSNSHVMYPLYRNYDDLPKSYQT